LNGIYFRGSMSPVYGVLGVTMGANGLALWDWCFKGESVRTEKQKPRSRSCLILGPLRTLKKGPDEQSKETVEHGEKAGCTHDLNVKSEIRGLTKLIRRGVQHAGWLRDFASSLQCILRANKRGPDGYATECHTTKGRQRG